MIERVLLSILIRQALELEVLADCRRINVMSISGYKLDRYGCHLPRRIMCVQKQLQLGQASDYVDSAKLPIN